MKRRKFIQNAAMLTGGAIVAPTLLAKPADPEKVLEKSTHGTFRINSFSLFNEKDIMIYPEINTPVRINDILFIGSDDDFENNDGVSMFVTSVTNRYPRLGSDIKWSEADNKRFDGTKHDFFLEDEAAHFPVRDDVIERWGNLSANSLLRIYKATGDLIYTSPDQHVDIIQGFLIGNTSNAQKFRDKIDNYYIKHYSGFSCMTTPYSAKLKHYGEKVRDLSIKSVRCAGFMKGMIVTNAFAQYPMTPRECYTKKDS